MAGTLFHDSKLTLSRWSLVMYRTDRAKTGLSAMELKRKVGVSYPTVPMLHHKIMQPMVERERKSTVSGYVQVEYACLGGECLGCKAGRGSENKVPLMVAVSVKPEGQPIHLEQSPNLGAIMY